MNRRIWMGMTALLLAAGLARAVEDPGRARIAMVRVTVYHATDVNPAAAGPKALAVEPETVERFRREKRLRFRHYRLLGQDTQPLLRSYESWAEPLKPSNEVMVQFEAQGRPTKQSAMLDLELWLGRKKTVKTDARIERDKPLLMLGPEWRGGRLIIAVTLAPNNPTGS